MVRFLEYFRTQAGDESGQALAEYALIMAFIAIVCVLALTALGLAISGAYNSIIPAF